MKKKENYSAPKVEFFEVTLSGVLCQSGEKDDYLSTSNEDLREEFWTL